MGEVLDRGATTQGVAQGWLTYIVLSSLLAWLGTRTRRNP